MSSFLPRPKKGVNRVGACFSSFLSRPSMRTHRRAFSSISPSLAETPHRTFSNIAASTIQKLKSCHWDFSPYYFCFDTSGERQQKNFRTLLRQPTAKHNHKLWQNSYSSSCGKLEIKQPFKRPLSGPPSIEKEFDIKLKCISKR